MRTLLILALLLPGGLLLAGCTTHVHNPPPVVRPQPLVRPAHLCPGCAGAGGSWSWVIVRGVNVRVWHTCPTCGGSGVIP